MSDLVREFHIGIRVGLLEPFAAFIRSEDFAMAVTGNAASGWHVDVQGKPAVGFLVPSGGQEPTELQVSLQGMAEHRTATNVAMWNRFEGYVAANSVHAFSPPRWQGDGWRMDLESFHSLPDGSLNHGSYRAWISPASLSLMKLTPANAVQGALAVTRIDMGVESAVSAVLSETNSGVLIDIPDLTFSSPTISIRRRGKSDCAKKCGKGRTCKNGRCKKKKRRKH
jgi:hypothetical protein